MENKTHLVLCVDDEVVGLRVRKILLERAGYQVLTAADGHSGLELFASPARRSRRPRLRHARNAGGEVAKKMRQTKPEVPILLLSAYVGLPEEVSSLVDIYMTKGEGAPALLEKLGNLLSLAVASHHISRDNRRIRTIPEERRTAWNSNDSNGPSGRP